MISKLAEQQIEKFLEEGLRPTVKDIVALNDIGLRVENGEEAFQFSRCPRVAWLGDVIVREPTIAKRLYIDCVMQCFSDSLDTKMFIVIWALSTPDRELPPIEDQKNIEKAVVKFRDETLLKFTDRQIIAAADWCLNGLKPDYDTMDEEEKKETDEVFDLPPDSHSVAKQLLLEAMSQKIPAEVANYALLDDLERMIVTAMMSAGIDIQKNAHTKWAARFYVAAGKIHTRLLDEKTAEEGKNGKE